MEMPPTVAEAAKITDEGIEEAFEVVASPKLFLSPASIKTVK